MIPAPVGEGRGLPAIGLIWIKVRTKISGQATGGEEFGRR
jgi:hypothetical protein